MDIITKLKKLIPKHKFFIGVDSDGCAFDTMEIKHKKVFIPLAISIWKLKPIKDKFIEVAEFINLYSDLRGTNRFPALVQTFEYLKERTDMTGFKNMIPDFSELKIFIETGKPLSNNSLKEFSQGKDSSFLQQVILWSEEGDKLMESLTKGNEPYTHVRESLTMACAQADAVIISAASSKALVHEWGQCGILQYMSMAAGQEAGGKKEQLQYAVTGKYEEDHVLLIGDAPGDRKAAKANNALFYPIMPGREEESWKRFYEEGFHRFINGHYSGEYEQTLINEFSKILSQEKPWGV